MQPSSTTVHGYLGSFPILRSLKSQNSFARLTYFSSTSFWTNGGMLASRVWTIYQIQTKKLDRVIIELSFASGYTSCVPKTSFLHACDAGQYTNPFIGLYYYSFFQFLSKIYFFVCSHAWKLHLSTQFQKLPRLRNTCSFLSFVISNCAICSLCFPCHRSLMKNILWYSLYDNWALHCFKRSSF